MLPSILLLNKIVEGNFDLIKTVNLLYPNGSLSKDTMLIFDIYLQPCWLYSGGGIIDLSDKNEMCTLYDQNNTYNETVYISSRRPLFSAIIICFDKNFVVYWLCSLMPSRSAPSLRLRQTTPYS